MNFSEQNSQAGALCNAIVQLLAKQPDQFVYALIYGVAYPNLYAQLESALGSRASEQMAQIFDARGDNSRTQYGPFLFQIQHDADASFVEQLTSLCTNDPRGISFLLSRLAIGALNSSLQSRLAVKCEDGTKWQLKFFDTRTLPVLAKALTREQYGQFFCVALEWLFLDRNGELKTLSGVDGRVDDYRPPLFLSERQAATFTDAAMPDSILHVLEITDDDLTGAFEPRERYQIVATALADATAEERNSAPMLADRARLALLEALEQQDKA